MNHSNNRHSAADMPADMKDKKLYLRIIYRIRHARPTFWLAAVALTLILFVVFVPSTFWAHLWLSIKKHKVLVSMLLLFCLLAVSLIWSIGQRIDALVFSFFNTHGHRPQWLDRTMLAITELGNGIVTIAIALILFFAVDHQLAYKFILGTLTLWLIVELMKVSIRRPRPFSRLTDARTVGTPAKGKSFPSGHTSQAFYIATLLLQYFHAGIFLTIVLYLVALLVGITRMYMGMHYPRDVLAGAILGTCWGFVGVVINSHIFGLLF